MGQVLRFPARSRNDLYMLEEPTFPGAREAVHAIVTLRDGAACESGEETNEK
jgi:hypothetical protein